MKRQKLIFIFTVVKITVLLIFSHQESYSQNRPQPVGLNPDTVFYSGVLGSISKSTTPNTGRTHMLGSISLTNADYSRGSFDGVPEELENFAISANLTAVFQTWKSNSLLRRSTLTIGTQQGLSNNDFDAQHLQWWYESNYHAAVIFVFPQQIATAINYLVSTNPNTGDLGNELDLSFIFASNVLNPSLEITIPLSNTNGLLLQLRVNPSLTLFEKSKNPLTLSFPVTFGAGLFNYFAPDDDFGGYVSAGLTAQLVPRIISAVYGKWNVFAGIDLIWREQSIAELAENFDNGGRLLILGRIGVGFIY